MELASSTKAEMVFDLFLNARLCMPYFASTAILFKAEILSTQPFICRAGVVG